MTNVVYFPGVERIEQDDKAAFTTAEISHTALMMIARMIIEPHTKDMYLGYGTSDEGEGWIHMHTFTHVSKRWTNSLPVFRVEKSVSGYKARFFTRTSGQDLDYEASSLREIYTQTYSPAVCKISRALMKMHSSKVNAIAVEIGRYPERRITTVQDDPLGLQTIDYSVVNEFNRLAAVNSITNADQLVGSVSGVLIDG